MHAHAVCDEGENERARLKSGQQLQHLLLRTAMRWMRCCYALPQQLSLPLLLDSHDQEDTSLVPVFMLPGDYASGAGTWQGSTCLCGRHSMIRVVRWGERPLG